MVTASESSTACISHNTSKTLETTEKTVDVITSGSIDEQSYTEEFRALEELLPADDIGLFDDVMISQTKSTRYEQSISMCYLKAADYRRELWTLAEKAL